MTSVFVVVVASVTLGVSIEAHAELGTRQPARQPATRQPATRQPATRQPATRQPATRQPATQPVADVAYQHVEQAVVALAGNIERRLPSGRQRVVLVDFAPLFGTRLRPRAKVGRYLSLMTARELIKRRELTVLRDAKVQHQVRSVRGSASELSRRSARQLGQQLHADIVVEGHYVVIGRQVRARARLFRGRDGQLLSTTSVLLPATRKVSWLLGIPPERPSTATRIAEHFKKHWYIWLIAGAVATAFIVTELGSDDRVARGVHGRYTPDNFATGSGTD